MTTKTITITIIIILELAGNRLPWVPEAFHARFPVSVIDLRQTKLLVAREKNPPVPRRVWPSG